MNFLGVGQKMQSACNFTLQSTLMYLCLKVDKRDTSIKEGVTFGTTWVWIKEDKKLDINQRVGQKCKLHATLSAF